ncbi:uncharacterized protein LOC144906066 [Branchiostoma floridae x Branchiostoma belcheri]
MKLCAVVQCSNSTYQLEKWKSETCQKHSTKNGLDCCDCRPPFTLFPFPTDKKDSDGRRRWNKLMNKTDVKTKKNWMNKPYDRVCSRHFPDGKPTKAHPDPILHLGYTRPSSDQKLTPKRPPPSQRVAIPGPSEKKPRIESVNEEDVLMTPIAKAEHDHTYTYKCDCREDCDCQGCFSKQKRINLLEDRVQELEQEVMSLKTQQEKSEKKSCGKKQVFTADTLTTDSAVNHCTGLKSKQAFNDMYKYVEPYAKKMTYWKSSNTKKSSKKKKGTPQKCGANRKLNLRDEFLLTLMRLRLGLTINFLAIIFGLVPSSCSQVVNSWVRFLSVTLQPLIVWPSRAAITETLPPQFKKKCRRIRCIIDCTEIFIERPRCLDLQAATWSDYKKHNTVKLLVGITPNGHISFLSKAYGGRASDVFITRNSGFLDLVEPNDVIMADRGFPIQEDLLLRHATLEIPPAAQGKRQMTRSKVGQTKQVANLRIHVERAINRLKDFKILEGTFPITLLPAADDIVTVCAALVNLQPDLIK